ncbi:MAG: hypothetical protein A2081_01990 [Elusimicrobia bacterium GWC2_61_19]|nr:MAG: hypothetical protein A2081_01990 [Elusimicrobia bacterium GWC2_61_19]
MIIFWRLLLSHLLADFTLQFDVVNRLKRKHVWGMLLHCLTHFVVAMALAWPYLGRTWVKIGPAAITGWWALGIILALHFVVDELRVYSMNTMGFRDGTVSFLADQFLHFYVLFMISPVVIPDHNFLLAEKWIGIACMLVLVTHFTTVLVYFVEKDLFGKGFPHFDEKYFLIFERVVLWAFFFVGGYWWVPFALAWVVQIMYVRKKRIIDLSRLNVGLSVGLTVALGLWTRYIYYGAL